MRLPTKSLASALVMLAIALIYWLLQPSQVLTTAPTAPQENVLQEATSQEARKFLGAFEPIEASVDLPAPDCVNPEMLEQHPIFAGEEARLDGVAVSGPSISSYRGLGVSDLDSLASQGDAAAMALLGAVSMLKARNIDAKNAVPFLLLEDESLHTYTEPSIDDPAVRENYEDARQWFYQSALRGRLFALYWVGEMDGRLKGGAVDQGWIGEDEYAELTPLQQSALMPPSVYNMLPFEIAPQLRGGVMEMYYEVLPKHEYQKPILDRLLRQFEEDLMAEGLPPINVPESTAPPWDQIKEMFCEPRIESPGDLGSR